MCILLFCVNFRSFWNFTQKPPGGVEGPPGNSYHQSPKLGFSSCTAWRVGAVRQALRIGWFSSGGFWVLRDVGTFGVYLNDWYACNYL